MIPSKISSVWFATEDRARSTKKAVVFDDIGTLDVTPEGVSFKGRKHSFHIFEIQSVTLARQQIPWVSYIVANTLTLIFMAIYISYFGPYFSGIPQLSTFIPIMVVAVFVLGNVWGILVARSTKWVFIEYTGENHTSRNAYFADGSLFGWRGILGGTQKMRQTLDALRGQFPT